MKNLLLSLTASILTVLPVYAADGLPPIKPGLWEIETKMDGQGIEKMKQCMSADSIKQLSAAGQKMGGMKCAPQKTTKSGGAYTTSIECQMLGSTMASTSTMTGDFNSQFTVDSKTSFTPPLMGQSGSVAKSTARFLGACTDGMKPGDALFADGTKINVNEAMAAMPDLSQLQGLQDALQGGNLEQLMQQLPNMEKMGR
jgi:hypothetical protein